MSSVAFHRLARVAQHLELEIDDMSKKRKAEQLAPWTTASSSSSSSPPSQPQPSPQSPTSTISKSSAMADVPNVPHSEAATMYSSRQIPLFDENKNPTVHRQDLSIRDVGVYTLPHLSSFLPNLPEYDNHFRRTKIPMSLQPAIHHHHGGAGSATHHTRSSHATPQSSTTTASPDVGHTSVRTAATPAPATMAGGAGTTEECQEKEIHELTYNQLIQDEIVLMDIVRRPELSTAAKGFVRAGPREKIVWAEGEVKAAIVTCGGLCPGLNDVVCELFSTLYYNYGVNEIYGIRSGFRGFWDPEFAPWLTLTPNITRTIHEQGGTVLGSSRGGFDLNKIIAACQQKGVNQIYIIGGDGTHRAADAIQHEARKRGLKMTVAGVPKTIDNDIGVIDRSFGFSTAVNEAVKAIKSAAVEASCAPNGLGIVQLMGRHAGYISAHATLASRAVDLCLIPEVKFPMTGPSGVLSLIEDILKRQGFAVVVVAEGAGAEHCAKSKEVDESGNARLPEIGRFLQAQITQHFKQKKRDVSIKYHDPSYMIRSVPANADDSVYCQVLAQNAVHGAMAGYTGFTSGLVNNRTVLLPISVVTATSPSYLNPNGRTWERVVTMTHQPKWSKQKHLTD